MSAIFKSTQVMCTRTACLSIVPLALILAVGAGQLQAQNPATSVNVDANANRKAINPNIYGLAMAGTSDIVALNAPINRVGGNSTSTYNWQQDAINLGNDWYFETWLQNTPLTPGKYGDDYINNTHAAGVGAEPMITIPMLKYIGKLGANNSEVWSFSVAKYGAQSGADPWNSDAGNGVSASTGQNIVNEPTDASMLNSLATQQAWLQHLLTTWGPSTTVNGVKYYILDNEPSIWSGTHRDVHPGPETYEELYNDIVSYAGAIRAADPNAKIAGPEEWTWWAMYLSGLDQANGTDATNSDYNAHSQTYYYPWLLQKLAAYEKTTGTKLLDILTVHCYNAIPDGSDDSASGQATRNQETRILWDPTFHDPSWETSSGIQGGIPNWIPTMRNWVNQYYPGLQIGCTEYNWGDEANLNGATTQADVLGIYGREGFDLATRWTTPANPSPTYLASQIYRNYDGKMSTFGDTSVSATVANPDNLSSFAAVRSKDGALTVMVVNKQQGGTPVTVSLANFAASGTAQAYQISSSSQTSIAQLGNVTVTNNTISTTVPSQSITLFVIPGGGTVTAPTAPTGLAASVGSGTVTLTWNAGGGATSYTVKRGTASGGPYTAIGTVTSPAPTTLTDSGLTNGSTYYYVVSGTNSAGTSPNSAQVAATPLAPPTFTSSATASPNPVTQNSATTITATVKCTANSLTGGTVQVIALDPNGATAASKSFTAQSFTTNQSQTYTLALTPALAGTYTVEVAVLSATGQQWSFNASAGSITVNSSLSFTSSGTATPSSVAVGATTAIAASVTANGTSGLANSIVELQVFNQAGTAVATQYWTGQTFAAGQTLKYSYNWTPASTVPAGTYTAMLGVFDSTWSTDYYWNGSLASITVTTGTTVPAAPTGLTATAGNASVTLTWTASSGASTYSVYRGTTAGGEAATAIVTGVTATTYTNTGLTNGTKYFYKVAAVNTAGTSPQSAEASATPAAPVPAAPTGLTATAGNASVTLAWTASSGAATYNVYRGATAGGEAATAVATGITATSYTDTGLTNGSTYFYKVAAVNTGGTSAQSAEASATPSAPVPTAPTGLTATAGNASVTLSWTASTGAATYNVYRGTTAGGEAATAIVTGITATTYTDSGLTNGTKYFYKVAAVNTAGTSPLSAEASATPSAPVPAAPTGLTATAGNASVTLTWTASTGAATYNVYRGATAGGEAATAVATGITATSYTDTGLTNGSTYFYKVAAVNTGGTSAQSAEASATPSAPVPTAPTGLTATAGSASVTLTWTASTGAATYNVYRGTTAGGEAAIAVAAGITATTYTDSGLTNGTKYFYKVAAVNTAGTSPQSAEASATPAPPVPAAPTGLTATAGNASVTLTWTASTGAATYNVYRGTTAGGEAATAVAAGITATTYTDSGLTNGTKYFYKVAAVNTAGTSPQSAEASATPAPPVPAAPTGLTATAGNASVTLTWTASTGAATYNVYRGTATGGEAATAIATGITATTYTDSALTNGTRYYYKVAAVNTAGTSPQSAEASATPAAPVPAAPTGLTATAGNASVTLNWTVSSGAATYSLYRGTTAGGEAATAIVTGITATTYTDSALTNGTKYFYKVAAVNTAGTSPLSAEASATPAAPVPAAPTGLTATAGNASVTLNWTVSSGAATYSLYRGTTAGGEAATAIVTGITATTYTDSALTNGTKYFYKVAAVNTAGTSPLSAEASATPAAPVPAAPTGLTATAGNASVTLNWTASTGAATYNVYRGTTAGGEAATAIVTGITATTYTDSGLTNGTKYFYRVAAVSSAGTSPQSAEASATPQASPAASIAATAGGGQSAPVNAAFSTALQATVKDATGNPVSGASVTFTAPASGASGKFGAATSATAATNAQGVATAPAFTANGTAGSYTVTAAVSGIAATASFALTNTAASSSVQVANVQTVYSPASQLVVLAATVSSASAPMMGGSVAFTVQGLGSATATVYFGQAFAMFQIPAGTAPGSYPISASYSGNAGTAQATGSGTLTMAKATPELTWNNPAPIASGTALGAAQLNAAANVAGSFVYTPAAGTVLSIGTGQQLKVVFTPANGADYNSATRTVMIDVTPAAGTIKLASESKLTRDTATQDVIVHVTVTNSGTAAVAGVQLTLVRIGWTTASGLPIAIGSIAAGKSATATVKLPGSVGDPGAHHTLTVSGTYTGGEFDERARVTLP